MKTVFTFAVCALVSATAFGEDVKCPRGVMITSQTFNYMAVSPSLIQTDLALKAGNFCRDQQSGRAARQIDQTRQVFRSSVPFLVQFEGCFICQ